MSGADHTHTFFIALAYLSATVVLLAVIVESLWAARRIGRAAEADADNKGIAEK